MVALGLVLFGGLITLLFGWVFSVGQRTAVDGSHLHRAVDLVVRAILGFGLLCLAVGAIAMAVLIVAPLMP